MRKCMSGLAGTPAIELPKPLLSSGLAPVSTRRIVALMPRLDMVFLVIVSIRRIAVARLTQPLATRSFGAGQVEPDFEGAALAAAGAEAMAKIVSSATTPPIA